MKMKKKFIALRPKTAEAEDYFDRRMLGLQSCELLETKSGSYHLKPIRNSQSFWVKMIDDKNWEIEK